jgi:hypothetical protein
MATQRYHRVTVHLARRYEFVAEFNDLPNGCALRASAMLRAGSDVAMTTIVVRRCDAGGKVSAR